MKLGIVGSRNIKKISMDLFSSYIPSSCTEVISGGAIGVDSFAEKFARKNSLKFKKILPDYELFGKKAPIIRNTFIVQHSDQVIAFWDYKSTGTAYTIRECIRLNIPVKIISIEAIRSKGI